jgi:hypothetical protein
MTVAFNPSGLINALEYNLYKGLSRSKTGNQQQIEACILETDKITEQKSAEYRTEAWVMVTCAVGLVALAAIGLAIEWKMESIKSDLSKLSSVNLNNLNPKQRINLKYTIESLEKTQKTLNTCKNVSNGLNIAAQKGPECYSSFSRVSTNQLDHQYKKKEMRLQQLQQERSSPADRSLLEEIKDMKRRQQQAKAAAG